MTGGNIMGIRRCCWKHSSTPHDSMEPAIARQTGSILEKPRDEAGWIDSTEPKSFRKRFSSFRCVEALNRLYAPAIHRLFRLPTRTDAVNNYLYSYSADNIIRTRTRMFERHREPPRHVRVRGETRCLYILRLLQRSLSHVSVHISDWKIAHRTVEWRRRSQCDRVVLTPASRVQDFGDQSMSVTSIENARDLAIWRRPSVMPFKCDESILKFLTDVRIGESADPSQFCRTSPGKDDENGRKGFVHFHGC